MKNEPLKMSEAPGPRRIGSQQAQSKKIKKTEKHGSSKKKGKKKQPTGKRNKRDENLCFYANKFL